MSRVNAAGCVFGDAAVKVIAEGVKASGTLTTLNMGG